MKTPEYYIKLFENYLIGLGYKASTIWFNVDSLKKLFCFLDKKKKNDVREIEEKDIYDFIEYMQNAESNRKKPYGKKTVGRMTGTAKHFFGYLFKNELILTNPLENIVLKTNDVEKKKEIFSKDGINTFLESVDTKLSEGLRDRTIFELMYSSGLRVSEIVNLTLNDVDLKSRILAVREAKGNKDRYVPFSVVAERFLEKYISSGRKKNEKALFTGDNGKLKTKNVRDRFNRYLENIGMKREGLTLHSIRHTTATHLLEAGVDVRYVAELLGHDDIETTVRYTHMKMESLKRVYKSFHPRENKYYEEVDAEYLKNVSELKEKLLKNKEHFMKYRKKS